MACTPRMVHVTLDSGAQVTVVPEEAVRANEFTGKTTKFNGIIHCEDTGKLANIFFYRQVEDPLIEQWWQLQGRTFPGQQ